MKNKYILIVAVLALVLNACDYLDREPGDTITKEQFFKSANAAALEQYCNYYYPRLIIGHGNPGQISFGVLGEDTNADYVVSWSYSTFSYGHRTIWDTGDQWGWSNIRGLNEFLKYYHLTPEADVVKNKYAGEILFFKAMDYFTKVQYYGDVPWYDSPLTTEDTEELYKARDSRILVMDNILRDINQAIEWLPKKTKVYRLSKDAAIALKARICLFEGTFRRYHGIEGDEKFLKEAYEAAGELMKSEYGYSLFSGSSPKKAYHELFIQPNFEGNSEVILSREYDPSNGTGNNVTRSLETGEYPIGLTKSAVDDYLCNNTGLPTNQCSCHKTHTTLINELKDRDPRLLQTVATPEPGENTYYLNGKRPAISKVVTGNRGASATGYSIVKFYNASEFSPSHNQGTLDAAIFRYAEILLIRAEAGAELGLDPELDKTINLLRKRVGFNHSLKSNPIEDSRLVNKYPIIKGADQNLIREIRRERAIELMGEGFRFNDIVRWKVGHVLTMPRKGIIPNEVADGDNSGYTKEEMQTLKEDIGFFEDGSLDIYGKRVQRPAIFIDPQHYLYPIPLDQISLNPKLKQNTGWES